MSVRLKCVCGGVGGFGKEEEEEAEGRGWGGGNSEEYWDETKYKPTSVFQ